MIRQGAGKSHHGSPHVREMGTDKRAMYYA